MKKVMSITNIKEVKSILGTQVIIDIHSDRLDKFECHPDAILMSFDWYIPDDNEAEPSKVVVYYSPEHFLILCETDECLQHFCRIFPSADTNDRSFYSLFLILIKENTEYLDTLEEEITDSEDDLLTASKKEYAQVIITYRKRLLYLKRYYEQLNYILEGLVLNENDMIEDSDLQYFKILNQRITRLAKGVLNLRDYVTQMREAYQAQIDIEQNSIMRTFTVITSIFLPLTLITGWYGMNLKMPEYGWDNGYLFVVILVIITLTICIIFFRRKKWL